MVQYVSNLPENPTFSFITAEPHPKKVFSYMRKTDLLAASAIGVGFPLAIFGWERYSPSMHPRQVPKMVMISVPFFLFSGVMFASQRSLLRFWGWTENAREAEMWSKESDATRNRVKVNWGDQDW